MEEQLQCRCPVCKGQCPRCLAEGCGICHHCRKHGVRQCPRCAALLEGYSMTELKDSLSFDRVMLILILVLVSYIAYKHYQE